VCRDFGVSRKTGYFDLEQKTLHPLDDRFGTRISPMSQVHLLGTWCYLCVRPDRGFGICWRAMPDDDEHYCFAVVL
jgi:hypothetical protein